MAFNAYYAKHSGKIKRIVRRYARQSDELYDDYISAMTERLWILYGRGHEDEGFIYNALRYAAINVYRKYRRQKRAIARAEIGIYTTITESVEYTALNRVTVNEVISRCHTLPARAIAVAFYRGATYAEIGRASGIHHEIVRRSIRRLAS